MPSVRTRRKSKLGTHLTKLRIAARLEQSEVATKLRKSFATVSKIENGHVLPDYPTLTLLLTVYNASDEDRQIAEDLREEARQESKRVEHSSGMPPKFRAFLRAEMDAATERTLQPNTVPGLLQTPVYAKAVNDTMSRFVRSEFDAQRAISSRLRRQERLRDEDPLELHAVVDESAIVRVIGDKTLMAGQLRYLLSAMERANIRLQVIPFEAGAYGPMSGGVTILGFPENLGDPDVLYLEYPRGGEWIENQDDVRKFIGMFDDASALALSIEESAALIRHQITTLEGR